MLIRERDTQPTYGVSAVVGEQRRVTWGRWTAAESCQSSRRGAAARRPRQRPAQSRGGCAPQPPRGPARTQTSRRFRPHAPTHSGLHQALRWERVHTVPRSQGQTTAGGPERERTCCQLALEDLEARRDTPTCSNTGSCGTVRTPGHHGLCSATQEDACIWGRRQDT